jgi:hypothetical protein
MVIPPGGMQRNPSTEDSEAAAPSNCSGKGRSRLPVGPVGAPRNRTDSLAADTVRGYRLRMIGYTHTKDDVQKRLRRIEGQIRGLHAMVESDRYCIDVLGQISAASSTRQRRATTPR